MLTQVTATIDSADGSLFSRTPGDNRLTWLAQTSEILVLTKDVLMVVLFSLPMQTVQLLLSKLDHDENGYGAMLQLPLEQSQTFNAFGFQPNNGHYCQRRSSNNSCLNSSP